MSKWLARALAQIDGTPCAEIAKIVEIPGEAGNFGDYGNFGTAPSISMEDWQAYFDERAGIREFDGGLPRSEAEVLAFEDTVATLGPLPTDDRGQER